MARTVEEIKNLRTKGKSAGSFSSSASKRSLDDVKALRNKQTTTIGDASVPKSPTDYSVASTAKTVDTSKYHSIADYDAELEQIKPSFAEKALTKAKDAVHTIASKNTEDYGIFEYNDDEKYYNDLLNARNEYVADHAWDEYSALKDNEDYAENSAEFEGTNGFTPQDLADITKATQNMSYDERAVGRYIFRTEGKSAYLDYLDKMAVYADKRAYEGEQRLEDAKLDESVGANVTESLKSIPMNVYGSIGAGVEIANTALQNLTGSGHTYNPYSTDLPNVFSAKAATKAGDIRESVAENIEESTSAELPIVGNVGSFAYQTAMSMGDSTLGALSFNKGYAYLMGASAFNSEYSRLKEEGASDSQAMWGAALSGVAESLFEKVSLENLLKEKSVTGWKEWVKETLKQAGVEGSEEVNTEIANIISNGIVMGLNSDVEKQTEEYRAQGYSDEEVKKLVSEYLTDRIVNSFIGGAVSGMGMGGVANVVQNSKLKAAGVNTNLDTMREAINGTEYAQELRNLEDSYKGKSKGSYYYSQLGDIYSRAYNSSAENLQKSMDAVANNEKEEDAADLENKMYESAQRFNKTASASSLTKEESKAFKQASKYNVTDKTSVKSEDAKILNVKVEDGDTIVVTDKGEFNVKDKALTLSQQDAQIVAIASNMEDQVKAEAFVKNYDGENVTSYERAYNMAYLMGKGNYSNEELESVIGDSSIDSSKLIDAYTLGKGQANVEDAQLEEDLDKAYASAKKASAEFKSGSFDESALEGKYLSKEEKTLKNIAKSFSLLGINVKVIKDDTSKSENGEYDADNNTVTFNLAARYYANSGKLSRRYVINTMAHELTHWMEDKALTEYKDLQNFLFNEVFGEEKTKALIADEQKKYEEKHGKELSYKNAQSEVMARACEDMLTDPKMLDEIMTKADLNLLERINLKIQKFFEEMGEFIKNLMNGYGSNAEAATLLRQNAEALEKAKDLWSTAFAKALQINQTIENVGVETDENYAYENLNSEKTFRASDYSTDIKKAAHELALRMEISDEQAEQYIKDVGSIANKVARDRDRLDYVAIEDKSAWVSNPEYGGSLDYSFLCPKRLTYTGTMNAILHKQNDLIFSVDDFLWLRRALINSGYEAPCSFCFVESARARFGKYNARFLNIAKEEGLDYIPTAEELTNPDKLEELKKNHKATYDRYEKFLNSLSQRKPKMLEERRAYNGDILKAFEGKLDTIESKNLHGGIRFNSFSDFEVVHMIDCMQAILDMSRVGLAGFGYTKQKAFAEIFGNTGLKINMSCVAKGVDENGRIIFDDIEGMNSKDALKLRNGNVGICCVVFTDEQLTAALCDDRIDYVLPFHRSQWSKKEYERMGLSLDTKDFTKPQTEKVNGKRAKEGNLPFLSYWNPMLSGSEVVQKYLDIMNSEGRTPIFPSVLDNKNGKWTMPTEGRRAEAARNYWKLLCEFKLYDSNGNGIPQNPVTPNFNMKAANRILKEYKGDHRSFPVAQNVVDEFMKFKETGESELVPNWQKAEENVKPKQTKKLNSDKESNAPTFYSKMSREIDNIKAEKIGGSSAVSYLKGKGVKDEEIKWSGIETFLEGKKSVTKAELSEFAKANELQIEEQTLSTPENVLVKELKDVGIDANVENWINPMRNEFDVATFLQDLNDYLVEGDITQEQYESIKKTAENNTSRWDSYTTDGTSNYRELLFKLPNATYINDAMEAHWQKNGVLAHARIDDAETTYGKTLFVEEIQSDWHNAGNKEGYGTERKTELENELADASEKAKKLKEESFELTGRTTDQIMDLVFSGDVINKLGEEKYRKWNELHMALGEAEADERYAKRRLKEIERGDVIPDAPFRNGKYIEYVMKRLLRMAAENGYDSIGWTTAKMQEDRWSDEFAEGYRIEYDQDIPKFMNKYCKQWGAKVEKQTIVSGDEVWSVKLTDAMKNSVLNEGQPLYSDKVLMGSMFSGGGTLEQGLVYQMVDKEFAVENNKKIAAVYSDNFGEDHLFVGDVINFDSKKKNNVFYLHASPVCKNYSAANNKGGEKDLDIKTAEATAKVLEEQKPQVFTLENVRRYEGSEAYNIIIRKLNELGYTWDADVYNAKDYGAATSRERLIVRAVRDVELPAKPTKVEPKSWYSVVEDLIDELPESPMSPYMKERYEAGNYSTEQPLFIVGGNKGYKLSTAYADQPAPTLLAKATEARIVMPDGRVLRATPRVFARIQGLPDSYKLPKNLTDGYRVTGNGIPTQLTKAVMGGVLDSAYEQTHNGQILYSEKEQDAIDTFGQQERLDAENSAMAADLERLKDLIISDKSIAKGKLLTDKNLNAVARGIISSTNSEIDITEVTDGLKELYGYILDNTSNLDYNDMMTMAYSLAGKILAKSKGVKVTDSYYKGIIDDVRKSRVRLDEQQIQEAKNMYGDRYRDAFMGSVILTKDGISLDSKWQEWAEMYPGVFDKDTNSTDMPSELLSIMDNARSLATQMEDLNTVDNTMSLAENIYDRFWNMATVNMVDEKVDEKTKKLRDSHKKSMARLYEKKNEAVKAQKLADAMHYGKILTEQRRKAVADQKALKEFMKKKAEDRKSIAHKKTLINKITETAKTLADWMKSNTAKEKIPEILKLPVGNFLSAIDYSSKQWLHTSEGIPDGTPTGKDLSIARSMMEVSRVIDRVMNAQTDDNDKLALDTWIDFPMELKVKIDDLVEKVTTIALEHGNDNAYVLQELDDDSLEDLADCITMIKHAVTQMNKFISETNAHSVDEDGMDTIEHCKEHGKREKENAKTFANDYIDFTNGLPYYVMKRFGKGAFARFNSLIKGWDKFAKLIASVDAFRQQTYTSDEVEAWSKEIHTFDVLEGEEGNKTTTQISITTPQLMSLYCLSKRDQARKHIFGGGIVVTAFKGEKGATINDQDAVTLTDSELERMLSELTERQTEVADALQDYMNTVLQSWGNEVSMKRFGIMQFTEENYFPIKSDGNMLNTEPRDSTKSVYALLNMGFTKKTDKNANNQILVEDIFTVFADHAGDMAKYNSIALPVLDMVKWFNYKHKEKRGETQFNTEAVKSELEKAYGKNATKYVRNLLYDLNGDTKAGRNDAIPKKLMRAYKTAAVAGNLQVAILQPISYFRALFTMDKRYLAKALTRKPSIEKCQSLNGIAQWKKLGFYNADVSRNLEELLRGNKDAKEEIIEKTTKLAELGDNITWGYIWNACEYEVMDKNPNLAYNSDEFNEKVSDRFNEVIYSTQVVDSTLTRSDFMRDPSYAAQMITAFKSEPTVSVNMLNECRNDFADEYRKTHSVSSALQKTGKKIARATEAYLISSVVESIVRAAISKWRNIGDDDDESFLEKFWSNLLGELNVLSKIPILSDIVNVFQGYDVGRTDMEVVESTYDAFKELDKVVLGEKDWSYKTTYKLIQAVSQLTGIPAASILREVTPAWNATVGMVFPSLRWEN